MAINIELLTKIRDRILAIPTAYNQTSWGGRSKLAPCGTVCCIAGHALLLAGKYTPEQIGVQRDANGQEIDFATEGSQVLGLRSPWPLFTGAPADNWPKPFATKWRKAKTKEQRARVAADYINHIIKYGKVE